MERPRSILVISGGGTFRKDFFNEYTKMKTFERPTISPLLVTQITFSKNDSIIPVLSSHIAFQKYKTYDMILVTDIFESLSVKKSLQVLRFLVSRARKQVLAVLPERCENASWGPHTGIQTYHPVLFCEFDFTYILLGREHENKTQLYSIFSSSKSKKQAIDAKKQNNNSQLNRKTLRLAYILPDQDLTGGMKQILLQAQTMHKRGHYVSLYTKSENAVKAIPPWSDLQDSDIDSQHILKPSDDFLTAIDSADAIILGWMEQAPAFRDAKIPVILWEQGSRQLFGDFSVPQSSTSKERRIFNHFYKFPTHILAVSPLVQTIVKARFGRASDLVCAAVKQNCCPLPKPHSSTKRILLVGDGGKDFKDFNFAIQALVLAATQGAKFSVQWATPTPPLLDMVPKSLRIEYHVIPSQEKLDFLYRSSDLLLSHSIYEAFSLPPLEAMAAGTAVLAVNNGGIETYAAPGDNCLLCQHGDLLGFTKNIHMLLSDDALRERIGKAGYSTALQFSPTTMCDALERILLGGIRIKSQP